MLGEERLEAADLSLAARLLAFVLKFQRDRRAISARVGRSVVCEGRVQNSLSFPFYAKKTYFSILPCEEFFLRGKEIGAQN